MNTQGPHTSAAEPIACTLSESQAEHQILEWHHLQSRTTAVQVLTSGVRMTFVASLEDQLRDLASRESACCSFLDITVIRNDLSRNDQPSTVTVDITTENPEALPVITALSGLDEGRSS